MRAVVFAVFLTACPAPAPDAAPPGQPDAADAVATPAATESELSGIVVETMDASGYTYVHVETDDGLRWAAVQQAALRSGDPVYITNISWMQSFHSKSLDRTFDSIAFGRLAGPTKASPHGAPIDPYGGMPRRLGEGADGSVAAAHGGSADATVTEPIAKAVGANARTVAEVFDSRAALDGKPVAIRGKVVKFTPNVMNKNWVHLQDGSGDVSTANHDLTVTTSEQVEVGEIVVIEGTLTADKDLGAGYRYDALVEDATIRR